MRLSSPSLVGEDARALVGPRRARGQRNPRRGCFSAKTALCGCQRAGAATDGLYPLGNGDARQKYGDVEEPSGSGITGRWGWSVEERRTPGLPSPPPSGPKGLPASTGRGPEGDGFRRQTRPMIELNSRALWGDAWRVDALRRAVLRSAGKQFFPMPQPAAIQSLVSRTHPLRLDLASLPRGPERGGVLARLNRKEVQRHKIVSAATGEALRAFDRPRDAPIGVGTNDRSQ